MITLATDFGTPYPAAMRGVLLDHCDARLVDIAHDFPRQDVRTAAFWLREVLPYFPPAVHCAVVDPGVGTDRMALAVRAGRHVIVAPDNGLALPAARRLARVDDAVTPDGAAAGAVTRDLAVYRWRYEDAASSTFHGRDVFAPAAARIHAVLADETDGWPDAEAVGQRLAALSATHQLAPEAYVSLTFPTPTVATDGRTATGTVLVVDGFGNAITNLPGDLLSGHDRVTVNGETVPAATAYADHPPGTALATVGSHGNVELAVNQGRGDAAFNLGADDEVHLRTPDAERAD